MVQLFKFFKSKLKRRFEYMNYLNFLSIFDLLLTSQVSNIDSSSNKLFPTE